MIGVTAVWDDYYYQCTVPFYRPLRRYKSMSLLYNCGLVVGTPGILRIARVESSVDGVVVAFVKVVIIAFT